jgi:hypothetical protein
MADASTAPGPSWTASFAGLSPRQFGKLLITLRRDVRTRSAADRSIDHLGSNLALQPRNRLRKDTVLIMDGDLVPTPEHQVAAKPRNQVIPHHRKNSQAQIPAQKGEHNASHRKVGTRVERVFARIKSCNIFRDCRLKATASTALGITLAG